MVILKTQETANYGVEGVLQHIEWFALNRIHERGWITRSEVVKEALRAFHLDRKFAESLTSTCLNEMRDAYCLEIQCTSECRIADDGDSLEMIGLDSSWGTVDTPIGAVGAAHGELSDVSSSAQPIADDKLKKVNRQQVQPATANVTRNVNELMYAVSYDDKEGDIYLPNEVFTDFPKAISTPSHIAFAYSYYFMTTYLYRYCKYVKGAVKFSQSDIKEFLGYAPNYQKVDYIIKKGGVLDSIGYTRTDTDFPVSWWLESDTDESMRIEFTTRSELECEYPELKGRFDFGRNFRVKYPVKSFYRSEKSRYFDGTFFEVENSHRIHPYVFIKAMSNKEVGVMGFYIYSYLKHKNDFYGEGYKKSQEKLQNELGLKNTTLVQYLKNLERYRYIKASHELFVIGMPKEQRVPNSYVVNDMSIILDEPREIKTRNVIYYETYKQANEKMCDHDNPFETEDIVF